MTGPMTAGIDVGGRRKGFDIAVLDATRVELHRTADVGTVVDLVRAADTVGVDAPAAWAPPGQRSRPDERAFTAAGICGIRYTPDGAAARARTDTYLEWVWQGLALYDALEAAGVPTVEVFPTAAWTRWFGPRGTRTRLAWTRASWRHLLASGLQVHGVDGRPTQDAMDAVAAALVSRQHLDGTVQRFGTLVVPAAGTTALQPRTAQRRAPRQRP